MKVMFISCCRDCPNLRYAGIITYSPGADGPTKHQWGCRMMTRKGDGGLINLRGIDDPTRMQAWCPLEDVPDWKKVLIETKQEEELNGTEVVLRERGVQQ